MAKYNKFLFDEIGVKRNRKDLYIFQICILEEKIKEANKEEIPALEKERDLLIKNKDDHFYNIRLKKYKEEEKRFLKSLRSKKAIFKNILPKDQSRKISSLQVKLFENQEKYKFYNDYKDLSYDAELALEESRINKISLPEIINFLKTTEKELERAVRDGKSIDEKVNNKIEEEIRQYKNIRKKALEEDIKIIKEKRKQGDISKKAKTNEILILKKQYKNEIMIKKFQSPKRSNKELIKSKKHDLKYGRKQKEEVLKANISDLRGRIPIETRKTKPINSYISFLIPGLGQILNKEYIKGGLFFIISLFTYLIAIPYALGYGNYQGDGIAGLINLAEGGLRIQKSLIFMIEGVIAVFLLSIASLLLYFSFKDVSKVEKAEIRGVRSKSWFSTKSYLKQEGFPYLVSFPAFLIIIFIVLVPIVTTILISFTGMDPQHQSKFSWIGLSNYKLIALGQGLAGSIFWRILGWTIIWTILSTTLAILIGFGLALLVNKDRIRFKRLFRTIYLLPWAVPAFITIMFFSIMLSPNGALSEIIGKLVGKRIEVKNSLVLTRGTLILLQGWLGSAYVFLLSTGVLQSIPKDLYEAADIDGASSWQKTRKITVPLVLFQTAPLLVGQYVFNFNNFSIIHLFNGGGPFNPKLYGNLAGSSDLLISYIYKLTIENQYQAIGAAITIVISIGLMFFAFLGYKNSKGFKEGRL